MILPVVWKINQATQRYIYPYFTRRMSADVVFLNVGYEEDPPMAIPLDAADEPFRPCIQLYHRLATQVDLEGKTVLEVGCGHGGGASYLTRKLRPASYTGLDLNSAGIDFCRRRHMVPGLDFVHGNAEDLPFPDQSFDLVINLESSLFYPHFPRFLSEVARVLRPGGHFLYADLRPSYRVAEWEKDMGEAPLRMLSRREINNEVIRGGALKSQQKLGPYAWMGAVTQRFRKRDPLESGDITYRMYSFARD